MSKLAFSPKALSKLLLLVILSQSVIAQEGAGVVPGNSIVTGYSCDAATCKLPSCMCPSATAPGSIAKPPLFITLTFDDSVNSIVLPVIINDTLGSGYVNPNGCPLSATFFVSTQYTDYSNVQYLYSMGHEIATHTMNHVSTAPLNEIVGAVQALSTFAGVPRSKITGFRQPFLNYSTASVANIASSKLITYDSSMTVDDNSVAKTWPFTLDNGPYYDCGGGSCSAAFKFPGLWEIPMYNLKNADGTLNAAMDPEPVPPITGPQSINEIYNVYVTNFKNHYNGDRRPLGIYLHASQGVVLPNHMAALVKFQKDYTSQYSDVYWISNQKLLAWMQSPTDISGALTSAALDCLMPAVDSSNVEICDGIDNDNDGIIDNGLQAQCYYPATQSSFSVNQNLKIDLLRVPFNLSKCW